MKHKPGSLEESAQRVLLGEMTRTYHLKTKLQQWDGSIGFWNDIDNLVSDLKDDGYKISASLFDNRIEVKGDKDAIADVDNLVNRKTNGLKSNRDAYVKSIK